MNAFIFIFFFGFSDGSAAEGARNSPGTIRLVRSVK